MQDCERLKKIEGSHQEISQVDGKSWYDYAEGIDCNEYKLNIVEYGESGGRACQKGKKKGQQKKMEKKFLFLTDLSVNKKNVLNTSTAGTIRSQNATIT